MRLNVWWMLVLVPVILALEWVALALMGTPCGADFPFRAQVEALQRVAG